MRSPLSPAFYALGAFAAAALLLGAAWERAWLVLGLMGASAAVLLWLPAKGEAAKAWLSHGGFVLALWLASQGSANHALSAAAIAIGILAGLSLALGGEALGRQAAWLASLALFGGVVAFFSSPTGGSGGMLEWASRLGLDPALAELIVKSVRKTIHFAFYGCFAFAAYRGLGSRGLRSAALALAFVAAHAAFDEMRQSVSALRTGSVWDVLLDLAGAAMALALCVKRKPQAQT